MSDRMYFGAHNAQAVVDALIALSMACGETVQGILRHNQHSAVASGAGLVEARGNPELAAREADAMRAQHATEAKRTQVQLTYGLRAVRDAMGALDGILSTPPGTPKQSTAVAGLAESAGTTAPGPKLALAGT